MVLLLNDSPPPLFRPERVFHIISRLFLPPSQVSPGPAIYNSQVMVLEAKLPGVAT